MELEGIHIRVPNSPSVFLAEKRHSSFIACNQTRADHFFHLYGKDESEAGRVFNSNAKDLLVRAKAVLDELGVPFWRSSGTCLGEKFTAVLQLSSPYLLALCII